MPVDGQPTDVQRMTSTVLPLLSKQGQVVTQLARELLSLGAGTRMQRVDEYAAAYDVSVGTMQLALEYLATAGAVRFEAHGRLGTFVCDPNYPLLWSFGQARPVIGAMPLPYSRRFEGLATGVRQQFAVLPLDLDLRFMRGSVARMQAVTSQQCDWALVSHFAAETAYAHGFDVAVHTLLGPDSYMAGHVLIVAGTNAAGLADGMRVGIDSASADHAYAVRALSRGRHIMFVEIEYGQSLELLHQGLIDATVWSSEDLPSELTNITAIPLNFAADASLAKLGAAAIVVNTGDAGIAHLLSAALDTAKLLQTQLAIVNGARLPTY